MTVLLAIDIGTSSGKAILFDAEQGRLLGSAAQEYPVDKPAPDRAEQHPDDWWDAVTAIVPRLLAETGLIGFVFFIAFIFNVLGETLSLLKLNVPWARFAAVAGVFAWVAIALYNLTQDSLTTPNIWIVPGILVGLSTIQSNKEAQ